MPRQIVSANYHDRDSPFHWLIRSENENPEQAVPFKSVTATGVAFCPSSDFEQGFGCNIVAICATATGSNDEVAKPKGGSQLRFNGLRFLKTVDHRTTVVNTCDVLYLGADGSMLQLPEAVIETSERKPALAETVRASA